MKKNKLFIRLSSFAVILLMLVGLLNSCTKKDQAGNVDFTIDLTDPQYSQLNSIGAYVYASNIIIFKDVTNNYVALSEYCTYDASVLTFQASYDKLVCSGCASQFDVTGNATFGRASEPLVRYNVQEIGSTLRIYSSN